MRPGKERSLIYSISVCGNVVHSHVNHVKRKKLGVTARPCVFLGDSPESTGWLVYDPIANRVVVTRDVTFQEDVSGKEALVGGGDSRPSVYSRPSV